MKKRISKVLFWLLVLPLFSFSQSVTVNTVVYPPFSPQFSYYIDNPNKISVTLINNSAQPVDVYLKGHFTGDNGIEISTEDGYKPSMPLTLQPNIPFQLTQYNIGDIFSAQHLVFSGITKEELMAMQGLPEGNYQVCFTVFDYNTDQQLSGDEPQGCSNAIMIQYVDPPTILTPVCGDSIIATDPQNVLFSWTVPVQTGVQFTYHFVMVEMHPGDRNPYDALASAVPPFFYETDVNINQLLMGPSEPQLIEGRSYAFVVQIIDPNNQVVFKNNGTSEACYFTYKSPQHITPPEDTGFVLLDSLGFNHDFDFIPFTTVQGQLRYKLASDAPSGAGNGNNQGGGGNPPGGFNFSNFLNGGNGNGANSNNLGLGGFSGLNFNKPSFGGNLSLTPPFGKGTLNEQVIPIENSTPLRNTMIRLVVRFGFKNQDGFFDTRGLINAWGGGVDITKYKFYDLSGNEISRERVQNTINKVVDVCTTDDQGNFRFDYQTDFFTGPVYAIPVGGSAKGFGNQDYNAIISLKIEVINQKFCSPDVEIFAEPGDNLQLQPQVALIKDYDIHLKVVSAYDYYSGSEEDSTISIGHDRNPKSIPGGQPIANAMVKVMRDLQKVNNEHPAILMAEGQQLGSTTKNQDGEFKDVFIGQTDVNGEIIIPHLVERWAVTDGKDQSPYFISVRTRAENPDSTYENNKFKYNFEPYFGTIMGMRISVESGGTTMLDYDAGWSGKAPVVYNHFYAPPHSATDRVVGLDALPPEIKGRLMVQTNLENMPLPNTEIKLYAAYTKDLPGMLERKTFTNKAGFFRFKDLQVIVDENGVARGPFRRINYQGGLYKPFLYPPMSQPAINLKYGDLYIKEFQLEPRQLLLGKVVDETGKPVAAYVKLLRDNPYVKTEPRYEYDENGNIYIASEVFEIPASSYGVKRIEIQPLSNSYFPDTVEVTDFDPHRRIAFTVYRKMHRLRLTVRSKETNSTIAGATVIVGDTMAVATTGNSGYAEIIFPSPGEQFIVKVIANGYSPKQASYNIPVGNKFIDKTMLLEPAMSIHGIITEETSGQPIDSALVYFNLQKTDGHSLYLEAWSDSDGKYTMQGIPMTLKTLELHVVKEGKNPSYIGVTKTVNINPFAYPVPSYDFKLKAMHDWDLSNIWGFPVVVENMRIRPQFGISISGYFHDLPAIPGIETVNAGEKVYFKNLKVEKGDDGSIKPVKNEVKTETYNLPVKLTGGFEGDMFIPSDWQYSFPLKVTRNGEFAMLKAALQLDLASFKFNYDFHSDLYLGDDTLNNGIAAFVSTAPGKPVFFKTRHYVFDLTESYDPKPYPIKNFRVFGFNASSTFDKAYYQDGVIRIGTTLHTDIPMANGNPSLDLKINAGDIVITKENIDLVHNANDQLDFELEKWRVKSSQGWTFDKTRDAIVIPRATIFTGLGVDAAVKGMLIKPDALREGEIDLQNGLSLGNIVKLEINSNVEPRFNYDAGVGHYRISLVGSADGPVAWVNNLPATPDRLEFISIGMLSDNSTVLSLNKKMRFYDIMDIYVDQIMSGEGFFKLGGMPELGIPGYVPTLAEMTFTKNNGIVQAKLEPLNGAVDCNGNVVFKLEQMPASQTISDKLYNAYGDFFIKPPPDKPGEKLKVRGYLTKTPTGCYIDVVPGQLIAMGKEKMKAIDGKISVTGNQWGELAFRCNTQSQGLKDENIVNFEVHGGIEANSDKVSVDEIDTPLGSLKMTYLFDEKALVGELTITQKLDMGFAAINSGMMATRFDPHGFYLGFAGNITMTQQDYLGGFLLGVYDGDLNDVAGRMMKEFRKDPPDYSSIHGFFVIGQRILISESFTIPSMVPPLHVAVDAGLGAYVQFDYQDPKFIVGGYAYLSAEGGVKIPPPANCYIGVKNDADFDIHGGYENGELYIQSCGILSINIGVCGFNTGISVLNKNKLSNKGNNEITLKLGDSCD